MPILTNLIINTTSKELLQRFASLHPTKLPPLFQRDIFRINADFVRETGDIEAPVEYITGLTDVRFFIDHGGAVIAYGQGVSFTDHNAQAQIDLVNIPESVFDQGDDDVAVLFRVQIKLGGEYITVIEEDVLLNKLVEGETAEQDILDVINAQEDFAVVTDEQATYVLSIAGRSALVYINGLLQPRSEYTQTGNQIVFHSGVGIVAGDVVSIVYLT